MTTRDEVLAMAEEADAEVYISFRPPQYRFTPKTLERFHALAVAPYVMDLGLCEIALKQKIELLKQAHAALAERDEANRQEGSAK